jgi:hypothetical protein
MMFQNRKYISYCFEKIGTTVVGSIVLLNGSTNYQVHLMHEFNLLEKYSFNRVVHRFL